MIAWLRERLGGAPAAVRDSVAPEAGERLLAWADSPQGLVVATTWRLWFPAEAMPRWLYWDGIDKAVWAPPSLTVTAAGGAPALQMRLEPARGVPAAIRARMSQALVFSRRESLAPLPGGALIVGRRSARTRELRWEVRYDPATRAEDPAVQARGEQLLAAAQEELARGVTA